VNIPHDDLAVQTLVWFHVVLVRELSRR